MDIFARKLRERARQLALSDVEVARRAGLNERRYGHYVTGIREPDLETLTRICTILQTTPNDLLGFEGGEAPTEESPAKQERKTLRERLNAACNPLQTDNLRLAVKQIETLLHHQMQQRDGSYEIVKAIIQILSKEKEISVRQLLLKLGSQRETTMKALDFMKDVNLVKERKGKKTHKVERLISFKG